MSDWFDEMLKDVNVRTKQRNNEEDNVAKSVKINVKNLDDNNAIIIVDYYFNNGTRTLTLYPKQRLDDFLKQVTTKRDIDVLKYVVKTLKSYVDMNNVLKELMTFDLDDFYEKSVKKSRVKLTNVNLNVNNVINDAEQNDVNNYDEQGDVEQLNEDNDVVKQQYDEQLLQQLRDLINDLNNVDLDDIHNNDELYNAANYVIQRFVTFLINIDNVDNNVINNVINYLKSHIDGDQE